MTCNVGQTPIYFSQYMSHHVEYEAVKASVLRVQSQARCDLQNRDFSGFFVAYISRTPYDNKHNAGGVEGKARREVNYYHSLVALVQRLQKIKFSECDHSLIGECTTQGELV